MSTVLNRYAKKNPCQLRQKSSGHVALLALLRQAAQNLCFNLIPEIIPLGIVIIQVAQHKSDDNDCFLCVQYYSGRHQDEGLQLI